MKTLSTGQPSTLASYRALTAVFFGQDSKAVKFLDRKIADSPNGALEEVLADERQMIAALFIIHDGDESGELLIP